VTGIKQIGTGGEPVVCVRDVSMAYKLYARPLDMLKEALLGGVRHDTFWALRGVSVSVCEGERLGIVGHNGAGKTTLLQLIAGNLKATNGQVVVNGRISSLLSQTPAWNLEETGLQNARFNLLIQGVSERRIRELVEEIIDFTELGAFIHHPVKTYSSGMAARLMFAIATAIEPEILIVDEVLGAGDGYFAGKAAERMQKFCARGRALLFVSHSTAAVQQMCNKALWLHNGSVRLHGEVEYVLKQYELDFRRSEDEALRARHIAAAANRTQTPLLDEVPERGCMRFRIVADKSAHFCATHYVRSIWIQGIGEGAMSVPTEFTDWTQGSTVAALDIVNSEWGRLHERHGEVSRTLAHVTGRRRGGQFTLRVPDDATGDVLNISVEIESAITDPDEELAVEYLDMVQGTWRPLACTGPRRDNSGWRRLRFHGSVAIASPEQAVKARQALVTAALPDVEIIGVYLTADDERTAVVKEREPFDLCVEVLFRRSPELADVGVKLSRSDGVYVFWQSSGLAGPNLADPTGTKIVKFRFDPNNIGAGEYHVTAQVSDGWDYPTNYPYRRVFARVIDAVGFQIAREIPELDFGVLNKRVKVEIHSVRAHGVDEVVIDTRAAE
jgi:lipopolysaccharide transport system ATP-binding protein